ncbi:uncharacterized protein LOC105700357 [Orussus abietinus]|uniref:uncharacterized protein LOC105700357 n=1 Tax=Orussus abietinus TaxID=222816 RepID=UPI00062574E7|nr:uncharacterized protein LOC105700357 [Orussus abietinus]XP_012281554.1 uncharacterized protein LOC105700357 [Orussus abietinus]
MEWLLLLLFAVSGDALRLAAYVSSGGLHGEIWFESSSKDGVKIRLALQTTLQYPDQQWLWSVMEFPVEYTMTNGRCDERRLGDTVLDLTELVGPLEMPGNETGVVEVPGLSLAGEKGLWGKSLLLRDTYSPRVICASITVLDKNAEKLAEARFFGAVAGTVWFRWLGGQAGDNTSDTIIYANLHHVSNRGLKGADFTEHHWKIYVTDIFDMGKEKGDDNCNVLQTVFDPDNAGSSKSIGDIDSRLGKIKVAVDSRKSSKKLYRDPELSLLPADLLGPHRLLYLVVFHPTHDDSFLACARIKHHRPIIAKALVNSLGVKGEMTLTQETPFNPTWVNISLTTNNDLETRLRYATKIAAYRIHELPEEPGRSLKQDKEPCTTTKRMYNPLNIEEKSSPPPGYGTQDQYAIGDLSGKLQGRKEGFYHNDILPGSAKLSGIYWDTYLPLSGVHSVVHRSLVLHKYNETDNKGVIPWVCGFFAHHLPNNAGQISMTTLEVVFRYPIIGRIIFRQAKHERLMDTTVIVENLVHADGSAVNNSAGHRWMIHDDPPGKDYYNWTGRCLSAGGPYDPYKVNLDPDHPERCTSEEVTLCRLGDLSRHGTLEIAGTKLRGPQVSRRLFTDSMLPLAGSSSILGKSLVIYDDHGPVARGERLACSRINTVYRRKAVVKDWFGNGEEATVRGKLEIIQQSEYDVTDVEVDLEGLNGKMRGYHVHTTPVEIDLAFPCEGTSLYGTWNPLNVNILKVPPPGEGTTDQYEMGDLSGKFGTLENRKRYRAVYNDTMLPLFGPRSILGRSVVIHKKDKDLRWACSTIERGYAPSEARELRAIASFHHPQGFAYGYIRMTQLVYRDDSKSETIIEVNLHHPGKHDRNVTRNHNWAIYVNPVGVDATVKIKDTRCVAAGYRWNPYFTQLADPLNEDLYRQECGPDLPLRCHVGDVSARLGPIDIGVERRVFTDQNFPLEGPVSAMGKSIVILDKDLGNDRFACANIEPDNDIVKYANIRKPPRFVVAQFLEDVRKVLGVPEWMLSIDGRRTKILHSGGCVQFLMHFKGPIANKLEQDFSKLISTGKLEAPSLYIPGYTPMKRKSSLGYRQCGTRDPNDKSFSFFSNAAPSLTRLQPSFFLPLGLIMGVLQAVQYPWNV